ncbi:MAG: NAD(P)/FAD-dependent oxidoreductase [Cryomorphaceae bacterium]
MLPFAEAFFMSDQTPPTDRPRIVILGAGFAGLRLARKLSNQPVDVLLIDKNNFHQFQPLFYQVATAGLAPSSISFPIRKAFHKAKNVRFRMAEVHQIDPTERSVVTSIGKITYDTLVIATGSDTNYFNNRQIEAHALPMKSVQESLIIRNRILENMEAALVAESDEERRALMNVVVVGGGPTGTEVSGALSEMRSYVLPKDYPELDFSQMEIHLIEASPRLLGAMSAVSSTESMAFLTEMGVQVELNTLVESYDGHTVTTKDGRTFITKNLIWAAGIKGNLLKGIPTESIAANGRIKVDGFNRMQGHKDLYVLGDIAMMETDGFKKGHPQVAQVAIQQADRLSANLLLQLKGKASLPFQYNDLGSMATVGRNRAVVDLPYWKFQGFFAWVFWLFVHLMSILGVKNRLFIFLEWTWNYFTYDQSLRLVIKQKPRDSEASD